MSSVSLLLRGFLILFLAGFTSSAQALVVVRMETVLGDVDIELYDEVAPLTVANFLEYVESGAYDGTFLHRSIPGFVLQGGGFFLDEGVPEHVVQNDPVPNEFDISNTRGTIAMAKLSGDPDSATSEWFFNLADNSANLDFQNGGFTVFGRVLGNGMEVVDAIAALPTTNAGGALSSLPVREYEGGVLEDRHYVIISRILQPRQLILPQEADFGMVGFGAEAEQVLTVLNQGVNPVTLGAIAGLDAVTAPFSLLADACSGVVLAPGASCEIRLGFAPTLAGEALDSFNIPSNDSGQPNAYVQLRGTGSLPLQVTPRDALDMGAVVVGESVQRILSLQNIGGIHAAVTGVSIGGTHAVEFVPEHDCALLEPGGSCQMTVTFSPASIEEKQARLSILTDYPEQALIEIDITGQGVEVPPPSLAYSSGAVDFGDVNLGLTDERFWSLFNSGGSDLVVDSISIEGPDASAFSITRNCLGSLAPNRSCAVTITFTSLTPGARTATLVLVSNDPEFPSVEVGLSAFGRDAGNRVEVETPGGGRVVLLSQSGTELHEVAVLDEPPGAGMPEGIAFRHGFYQFNLELPEGAAGAVVAISFPAGETPLTYYKYGRTPDNATPHWYEFLWDGETGAVIQDNVVTLYLVDGARGDEDLTVNGVISDPGGPGYSLNPPGDTVSSGGGCVMRATPVPFWSALDLLTLAGFIGWLGLRSRSTLNVVKREGW